MALMACPEGAREVSDEAPSRPDCGAPIASAAARRSVGVPLVTVQETSKRLEGHVLMSALLVGDGIIWLFSAGSSGSGNTDSGVVAALNMFGGLVRYTVTKLRIWWRHT